MPTQKGAYLLYGWDTKRDSENIHKDVIPLEDQFHFLKNTLGKIRSGNIFNPTTLFQLLGGGVKFIFQLKYG